jgi:hypothetical protein
MAVGQPEVTVIPWLNVRQTGTCFAHLATGHPIPALHLSLYSVTINPMHANITASFFESAKNPLVPCYLAALVIELPIQQPGSRR